MIYCSESIRVPTFRREHHQEMDIRCLSENDLETLWTKDPFMYHSIPSAHRAAFTFQEVDNATTILSQLNCIVTRKSRVSTECHPCLMMEELLQDEEFESHRSALVNRLVSSVESDNEQQPEQ